MMVESRKFKYTIPLAVLAGFFGMALSLGRILAANQEALITLLWAEDGLFPLCAQKAGFLTCVTDPYAGYLLTMQRLLAQVVAWTPFEHWSLTTNLLASLVAGLSAGASFIILHRAGITPILAILGGIIPILLPLAGFEAVNSLGSSYMLLLYTLTLALALPSLRPGIPLLAIGLLLSALTIPVSVFLLIPVLVQAWRRRFKTGQALVLAGTLILGLLVQFLVVMSTDTQRPRVPLLEGFSQWVSSLPAAVLSLIPGAGYGKVTLFDWFEASPSTLTGWLIAVVLITLGVWFTLAHSYRRRAIGLLLLAGVSYSLIPTVVSGMNNRYYVPALALWLTAGLLTVDSATVVRKTLTSVLVTLSILVLWYPAFPASSMRTHSSPPWDVESSRVQAQCESDPKSTVTFSFTPDWPTPNSVLVEPTTATIPCKSLH